jgi:hypothetical protein
MRPRSCRRSASGRHSAARRLDSRSCSSWNRYQARQPAQKAHPLEAPNRDWRTQLAKQRNLPHTSSPQAGPFRTSRWQYAPSRTIRNVTSASCDTFHRRNPCCALDARPDWQQADWLGCGGSAVRPGRADDKGGYALREQGLTRSAEDLVGDPHRTKTGAKLNTF